MLLELGIKHCYTRPYREQTNGKIEPFWRTLDDDVIDGATFDNLAHFGNELFVVYYNNHRPHQASAAKPQSTSPPQRQSQLNQRISELAKQ